MASIASTHSARATCALALALALGACSPSTQPTDGGTDIGITDTGGPDSARDDAAHTMEGGHDDAAADATTPPPDGGGADAGPDAPVEPMHDGPSGRVIASQAGFQGENSYLIQAIFRRARTAGCVQTRIGRCDVSECTAVAGDAGVPDGGAGRPHAGVIRFTGPTMAPELSPDATGEYGSPQYNDLLWRGGESVRVAAMGSADGVPAFDVTVAGPARSAMAMPATDAMGVVRVDRRRPFDVELTEATAGDEVEVLFSTASDTTSVTIECGVPLASGGAQRVSVPAEVLGRLPPDSAGFLNVGTRRRQFVRGGEWLTTVMLYWSAALPGDVAAALEFQTVN